MTLNVDRNAPGWAQQLVTDIEALIERRLSEPRPGVEFTVATLPPAADYRGVTVFVSDGAGNKLRATSDGSAWYYPEGTAV